MSRPILPVFVSYLLGLIAGYYLNIPFHVLIASTFILVSLTAASILLKMVPQLFFVLSLLTLVILGTARMEALLNPFFSEDNIINLVSDEPLSLEGQVCAPPETLLDKTRFQIELSSFYIGDIPYPVTGRLLLTIGEKERRIKYGDRIRFLAKVRKPRNYHNPGGFDYERYLALKGIFVTAYLRSGEGIIKTSNGKESLRYRVEEIRETIRENTFKNGGKSAPVLLALITGEQGEIPKDVRDAFSRAGTAHILAISGEHIGMISLISFAIFLWLLKRSERLMLSINIYKTAAIMTFPVIALYSLIAGSGFSIIRAAIMGGTVLGAVLFDRRKDIPSLIAFAAFLMLAVEPEALFDISFQLSFASVISIAVVFPRIKPVSLRKDEETDKARRVIKRLSSWFKLLFLITLTATIGTAPVVAYYFNRVSLISPISNILIVPVVGFTIVPIGLLSSLISPVSPAISGWLISISSTLISFIVKLTDLFASFPLSSVRIITPNLLEVAVFYTLVILITCRRDFKWAGRLIIIMSALMLTVESFYFFKPWFQNNLRVTFLDVGQGESALIEFPGGRRMLIDGGGSPDSDFDIGERVVAPFLWHKRIGSIDCLVLSHPNSDHYGGFPFILRNFRVGEVWESGVEEKSSRYIDFKTAAEESKAVHRRLSDRDSFNISGAAVEILNPPKVYTARDDRAANNGSLVLKVRYGDTSFLFTGDIEKGAEHYLLSKGEQLKSMIIKVPHHGSLTSSSNEFLGRVHPGKAIFSVGYNNHFGFPKEEIVQRYKEIGAEIYRTDRDGAITAVSDGINVRLSKSLTF